MALTSNIYIYDLGVRKQLSGMKDNPSPIKLCTAEKVVHLRDVRLSLLSRAGTVDILNGIDLDIKSGEAVGIVGPSGSGKTTLLMVMSGLERINSGKISIAGQNFSNLNEDDLARIRGRNIGIVFQSFHLVPTMTAIENVALTLEFLGQSDAFEIAEQALSDVGLSHRFDHFPAQLSGGEQQRVALARAIAPRPRLLLADEPTGNLDGSTSSQILDLIFDLQARHGATLILVTHDPSLADRCQRLIEMNDGRITRDTLAVGAALP